MSTSNETNHHASLSEVHQSVETGNKRGFFRRLLAFSGPAYLVAVGYMDPGNWATDIEGGSGYGYSLIWVLLMSNLMALLLQSLSARLGIVRGLDLAQASRLSYPKLVNYFLWFLAEIAIAACDLAEVLGMAIGINLLFHIPLSWAVLITVLDTFLLLFLLHYGIRKIEAFILSLVSVIGISFLVQMFLAKPEMAAIAGGLIPGFEDEKALYIAIGIIGATVMPHNLYLHSSLVQTRRFGDTAKDKKRAIKFNFIDSAVALNLAFFVNAAILILAASTFFTSGHNDVREIQDAHHLLAPLIGTELSPMLFAIALIAAGQSSTVTGTLAGQIVMEGYLSLRIRPWVRRIITRLIAIIPAFLTAVILGDEGTGKLLVLSQVILSLQLGFAVIPLIHMVSNKEKMGEFAIKTWLKVLAWLSAGIIVGLNARMVYAQLSDWLQEPGLFWLKILVCLVAAFSAFMLLYITFRPAFGTTRKRSELAHGEPVYLKFNPGAEYRRICIAVDFSDKDRISVNTATGLGGKNAEYLLVHVLESPVTSYFGKESDDHESKADLQQLEIYRKSLEEIGYHVSVKLAFGSPARALANEAQQYQADLLIMGAHGHRAMKDILLGTTIDAVRHRIDIPVLVVR